MNNSHILDLPVVEIKETLASEPIVLYDNSIGKCLSYLKNFDYYYIFCIVNPDNPILNQYLKLPTKFVEQNNSSHRNLLDEFLKIAGVPFANIDNNRIVTLTGKHKEIHMNPITYNRTKNMTFALESGDTVDFVFTIDIILYRDFLEKYQVRV